MKKRDYIDFSEQKSRIALVLFFVIALFIISIGRLFFLQVFRHDYYTAIANSQHWTQSIIQPRRGTIYVRDDMVGGLYPLATNKTLQLVFASPEEIENKDEVAQKLSSVIKIEKETIYNLLVNNHTYVLLKHRLDHETANKVEELELDGIYLSPEQTRYYPEETLASQILGYVDVEGKGNYGLEQYFDKILSGEPGMYKAEIAATGSRIAFGNQILTPAVDGFDIVLTINRDVQAEAERLVKESVDKFYAENGSVIVMNPENGEIIAMANYPNFNPNKYSEVKDIKLFRNSCVNDLYEPGSTFKVVTMAAGLDDNKIEPDSEFNDTGQLLLDGHKIMNSDRKAHGLVTMTEVLEQSLNTGTSHILELLGRKTFYKYLLKFGFSSLSGIEQPLEESGVVYKPDEVNDHTYATMTFGQSISTTPLQMITAFAAIANEGYLVKPHLVSEIVNKDGSKELTDNRPIAEVISKESAIKLTQMMISVVENGHGKQAGVKGYKVAGKTGTAQVPKEGGGYYSNKNIGSFIGFGPADSPRFVVLAKIDSPKGIPWAETSAAPIVGNMLDFLFKYYQIPPTENN